MRCGVRVTSRIPSSPQPRAPCTLRTSGRPDGEASSRGSSGTLRGLTLSGSHGRGDWRSGAQSGAFWDSAWCSSFRVPARLRPHTVSFAFRPGSNTSISGISGPAADSVSPAAPAKTNAGSETHLPSQPNRLLFRTLSGRVARPAPPSGGRSDPHRRNIAGCYGSDHSAGKVLCSQACTAS